MFTNKKCLKHKINEKNLIEVEGSTDLLSVDNKSQIYTMINYVSITSYEQNMNIKAKNLTKTIYFYQNLLQKM